jgi:hypothetical protein
MDGWIAFERLSLLRDDRRDAARAFLCPSQGTAA